MNRDRTNLNDRNVLHDQNELTGHIKLNDQNRLIETSAPIGLMQSRLCKLGCSGLVFFCAGVGILTGAAPSSWATVVEVVESVPAKTSLGVPGIRQTETVWLEMIQAARVNLDLEQFYITDQAGEALAPVLQAIRDAAARGVQVRLLMDAGFFKTYPADVRELASHAGITVRTVSFSSFGGIQHAKYFMVDHRQLFIGSQNFDWRALDQIHEIGIRTDDPASLRGLQSVFDRDWLNGVVVGSAPQVSGAGSAPTEHLQLEPANPMIRDSGIDFVASPPAANPSGVISSQNGLLALIGEAKQSIRLQVMEYSSHGWCVLESALRAAAKRGVQVELMIDIGHLAEAKSELHSLSAQPGFEVRVVTIPQLPSGPIPYARLIHSKYLVVDGAAAWVGSENWTKSYFENTRNVGLVLHLPQVATQLNQVYDTLWNSPYAATEASTTQKQDPLPNGPGVLPPGPGALPLNVGPVPPPTFCP